jgi:hypothetical protein
MTDETVIGIDFGTSTTLSSILYNGKCNNIHLGHNTDVIETVLCLNKDIKEFTVEDCYNESYVICTGKEALDYKKFVYDRFKPDFSIETTNNANKLTRIWMYTIFQRIKIKACNNGDLTKYRFVIGVPAAWDKKLRETYIDTAKDAAFQANLQDQRKSISISFCPEPIAAVLASDLPSHIDKEKYCLFFDFGGGTLDLSLVKVKQNEPTKFIYSSCDPKLGGRDFDKCFTDTFFEQNKRNFAVDKYDEALNDISRDSDKLKYHLGYKETHSILICDDQYEIKRNDYLDYNHENIERIKTTLNSFFEADPVKIYGVKKEDIKDIIKVGGASQMFFVNELLDEYFGNVLPKDELFKPGEPQHAVSQGLPRFLTDKDRLLKDKEKEVKDIFNENIETLFRDINTLASDVASNASFKVANINLKRKSGESKARYIDRVRKIFYNFIDGEMKEHSNNIDYKKMETESMIMDLIEGAKLFAKDNFGEVGSLRSESGSRTSIKSAHLKFTSPKNIASLRMFDGFWGLLYSSETNMRTRIRRSYINYFSLSRPKDQSSDWERIGGFFYQIVQQVKEGLITWDKVWGKFQKRFVIWEDE